MPRVYYYFVSFVAGVGMGVMLGRVFGGPPPGPGPGGTG